MRLNLSTSSWQWQGMRRSLAYIVEVEDLAMDCIFAARRLSGVRRMAGWEGIAFLFWKYYNDSTANDWEEYHSQD